MVLPDNATFEDAYDQAAMKHVARFTFDPNESQIGDNYIRISAIEDPNRVINQLSIAKVIKVKVLPAKLPHKMKVRGCRIIGSARGSL